MGTVNDEWGKLAVPYFKRLKKEREERTLRMSTRLLVKVRKDRLAATPDGAAN